MIRRATEADVEEIVAIFEPSFGLLDFLPKLHTHEEHLAFFGARVREDEVYILGRGFAVVNERLARAISTSTRTRSGPASATRCSST